ncbi:LicD family-domain-containing protein [Lineolata rhizophorae]|uniref:LicD family-domain-containing protein n=1 Tax=Lineolata rhizophorae TaxID=578093 RepID=A0A6A6PEX8_9PEZI|nr:LicD family-domain-containing protein [Lineolata rhizophorae]
MRCRHSALALLLLQLLAFALGSPTPTRGDRHQAERRTPEEAPEQNDGKYFHEQGGGDVLNHYDRRFFKGVVVYRERKQILHDMITAYAQFFTEKRLQTWIAHGTLLGWWWNAKILPWDWDIDTQVSDATLKYMGAHLNHTTYVYNSDDKHTRRRYLLDVNPYSVERVRGNGKNIIDARWIDVSNGLYIDITGLSDVELERPGILSCKNNHHYRVDELYPLRLSSYEGVQMLVPYAYESILADEYTDKALTETHFEGHNWDADIKEWIQNPEEIQDSEEAKLQAVSD